MLPIYAYITYLFTPWCRILLEKLTGLQLVKKFPHFTEPEGSLPHSQASATCIYPGPAQSIFRPLNVFWDLFSDFIIRIIHVKRMEMGAMPRKMMEGRLFFHTVYIHGSVHRKSNLITVQQDADYSVYYISVRSSTCFAC